MSGDLVLVNGTMHWTTSNGVRTFIGPVRHARTRSTMKAREIAAALRRKTTPPTTPTSSPTDVTVVMPAIPVAAPCDWCRSGNCPKHGQSLANQASAVFENLQVPTITLPEPESTPKPPKHYRGRSRRIGRLARVREDITDALYDDAWQKMARNTALTIGSYASLFGGMALLGKVVWWVLSLSL